MARVNDPAGPSSPRRQGIKMTLSKALGDATEAIPQLPERPQRALGRVVEVIEGIEISDSTVLSDFQESISSLVSNVLKPLLRERKRGEDLGSESELGKCVIQLAEKLKDLVESKKDIYQRKAVMRMLTSRKDKQELIALAKDMRKEIGKFLADERVEKRFLVETDEYEKQQPEEQIFDIEQLEHASAATYEDFSRSEIATCHTSTRNDIVEDIMTWAKNQDEETPRIFWLRGMAGTGKSTIARSVAERAKKEGLLGANFFFSGDIPSLCNPKLVFPTLAFQLAHFDTVLGVRLPLVVSKLKAPAQDLDLESQFNQLILEPLTTQGSLEDSRGKPILIVLDAIDECASEAMVKDLLGILFRKLSSIPRKFLVFLASRPEDHIESTLRKEKRKELSLDDVEYSVVQQDIKTYLSDSMSSIPAGLGVVYPDDWPKEADIQSLTGNSGRIFVYAAMVLRFIGDDRIRDPASQLNIVTEGINSPHESEATGNSYAALDELYSRILLSSLPPNSGEENATRKRINRVIGTLLSLRCPLAMNDLIELLLPEEQDLRTTLYSLSYIIRAPRLDSDPELNYPRFHHSSFPEFMKDPKRCQDESLRAIYDEGEARTCLRCFEIMSKTLRPLYIPLNIEGDAEPGSVDRILTPLFRYACEHWASHLVKTSTTHFVALGPKLQEFVDDIFNTWFSVMKQLGLADVTTASLQHVISWMGAYKLSEEIRAELTIQRNRVLRRLNRSMQGQGQMALQSTNSESSYPSSFDAAPREVQDSPGDGASLISRSTETQEAPSTQRPHSETLQSRAEGWALQLQPVNKNEAGPSALDVRGALALGAEVTAPTVTHKLSDVKEETAKSVEPVGKTKPTASPHPDELAPPAVEEQVKTIVEGKGQTLEPPNVVGSRDVKEALQGNKSSSPLAELALAHNKLQDQRASGLEEEGTLEATAIRSSAPEEVVEEEQLLDTEAVNSSAHFAAGRIATPQVKNGEGESGAPTTALPSVWVPKGVEVDSASAAEGGLATGPLGERASEGGEAREVSASQGEVLALGAETPSGRHASQIVDSREIEPAEEEVRGGAGGTSAPPDDYVSKDVGTEPTDTAPDDSKAQQGEAGEGLGEVIAADPPDATNISAQQIDEAESQGRALEATIAAGSVNEHTSEVVRAETETTPQDVVTGEEEEVRRLGVGESSIAPPAIHESEDAGVVEENVEDGEGETGPSGELALQDIKTHTFEKDEGDTKPTDVPRVGDVGAEAEEAARDSPSERATSLKDVGIQREP